PGAATPSPRPATPRTRVRTGSGSTACGSGGTSRSQQRKPSMSAERPTVGILVGSESDVERMQPALDELAQRGIAHELEVRSAHRTPEAVADYARSARGRGVRVVIAGAGLAAALPGAVAAHTDLPVIGVPLRS